MNKLTLEERQQFVNKIKIQLESCNYGFQVVEDGYNNGYSIKEAKNMKAIKELLVRLEVWKVKGTKDTGSIKYPEAKRKIDYMLDESDTNKCKINLMKFRS